MESYLPTPTSSDRCALCELSILPTTHYVHTYDELGRAQWWHMTCRDRMIPFLLVERDGVDGRDEEI